MKDTTKMKKLTSIGFLLTLSTFVVSAQFSTPRFSSGDFLAGAQELDLTNNSNYAFGQSNLVFLNSQGTYVYANSNLYLTNFAFGGNAPLTNANAFFGNAWYDLPSFSDANGNNASASIAVTVIGGATGKSTNTLTFSFSPLGEMGVSPNGFGVGTNVGAGAFTFSVVCQSNAVATSNAIAVTTITNIPTSLMQGAAGWRLTNITNSDAGGAAWQRVIAVDLNGFRP